MFHSTSVTEDQLAARIMNEKFKPSWNYGLTIDSSAITSKVDAL